jgi:hypothetical protein
MKPIVTILFALAVALTGNAQPVPADSLYLGHPLPGNKPETFLLAVTPGSFAAERMAVSRDGSEIYYSEVKSYYPVSGDNIRWYRYLNNRWTGSSVLFEGFNGPALSVSEDTLFMEHDFTMYYSVKSTDGWTHPRKCFTSVDSAHYLQVTGRGQYYASARSAGSVGLADWSRIDLSGRDTTTLSLGYPVNRIIDDLDFFMARDESYLITCPGGPLGISFPLSNGKWTNSRYFPPRINFGLGGWGAYVSPDNRYLFYTTGTKPDYSDTHVYWVSLGGLADSLKLTNLPPYVRNKPAPLHVLHGKPFTYIIPADAIVDDDGGVTRIEILMIDGRPLPSWMDFNAPTLTLTGIPPEAGEVTLRCNGYDDHGTMAAFRFVITVSVPGTNFENP